MDKIPPPTLNKTCIICDEPAGELFHPQTATSYGLCEICRGSIPVGIVGLANGTMKEWKELSTHDSSVFWTWDQKNWRLHDKVNKSGFALEGGELGPDSIRERLATREAERERLQLQLSELKQGKSGHVATRFDIERVRPYVESLKESLARAPIKTQRAILKSFIKRIDVEDASLTIEFAIPQPGVDLAMPPHPEPDVLGMVTSGTPERTRTSDLRSRSATL